MVSRGRRSSASIRSRTKLRDSPKWTIDPEPEAEPDRPAGASPLPDSELPWRRQTTFAARAHQWFDTQSEEPVPR